MNEGYYSDKKCRILHDAFYELTGTIYAYDLAKKKINSLVLNELIQEKKQKRSFSNLHELLKNEASKELSELLNERSSPIFDWLHFYKNDRDFFDPDFQFSDVSDEFELEFHVLIVLFQYLMKGERNLIQTLFSDNFDLPEIDDPRVDIAVMKGLFHAGKMIERMKREGIKRYNTPDMGSKPAKDKPGYQKVMEVYADLNTKGMSKSSICGKIEKKLTILAYKKKRFEILEKKGGKLTNEEFKIEVDRAVKKFVYSTKTIGRILKKEGIKKFS